jgi:hypothetical protein
MCVTIAKHMLHLVKTFATYVYEVAETLETNTCNMHVMQHPDLLLQHSDETLET